MRRPPVKSNRPTSGGAAVRIGKRGEMPRRDIAWKHDSGTPDTCSPVVWDRPLL